MFKCFHFKTFAMHILKEYFFFLQFSQHDDRLHVLLPHHAPKRAIISQLLLHRTWFNCSCKKYYSSHFTEIQYSVNAVVIFESFIHFILPVVFLHKNCLELQYKRYCLTFNTTLKATERTDLLNQLLYKPRQAMNSFRLL